MATLTIRGLDDDTRARLRVSEHDLEGRVEPFDAAAATHYADLVSDRDKAGRPIGMADAQIAAICRSLGATLATRNTGDFQGTGIDLLDPWQL
jgi:predicted nucleic acid-binding protein